MARTTRKKHIERLTAEQEARVAEYRDKWTAIGLSTAPADKPAAEAAIIQMYAAAGLPAPKIVWCGSPLSQGLTRAIILDRNLLPASVGDSVRASVGDSVRASVGDSVWASVGASVRASVGDSVRDSVRASVRDSVWASVGDSVYGSHDAGWLSYYSYFRDVVGLSKQTDKLQGLTALAQSAGWALPHRNICWVSERHHILARDDRGRLHSLTGPAVAYPDGWAIYAVHGVRVPAQVIEAPETLTVQQIETEPNAEVRRVMVERYGLDRFILESGATLLHTDEFGALYQKALPNDEPLTVVHVVNSTPEPDGTSKMYMLRVHPELRPMKLKKGERWFGDPQALTARNAVASTFGLRGEEYNPSVQT